MTMIHGDVREALARTSVVLPASTKRDLERVARLTDRSVAACLRQAVTVWLERFEPILRTDNKRGK